jgi:UDP-glucuronate 4-epimerase
VEVFPVDISNLNSIREIFNNEKPDVVVHLAAQAGVRLSLNETHKYVSSNLVGFSNVLQAVVESQTPNFLYASSSSVYGDSAKIPYIESENNLLPNSFYGATKLSNEILTPTLIKGSKTRARGFRLFTVYGPWGRPDMAYFRVITAALSGNKFSLFGDGSVERDFTYIDDVVHAVAALHDELINREFGFNDIVNIGGGRPVSMLEVLRTISEIAGKKVEYSRADRNLNDVALTISDSSYLYQLTNYKPMTDIASGLREFVNWGKESHVKSLLSQWVNSVQ